MLITRLPRWKLCTFKTAWRFVILFTLAVFASSSLASDEYHIRILYPILAEPYASIFDAIMQGVEDTSRIPISRIALPPNPNIDELRKSVQPNDEVIALGGRSIQVAKLLPLQSPPIVGAVVLNPARVNDSTIGVSLTPDPRLLFEKLRLFAPDIKEVWVVYRPGSHTYLIELANNAAHKLGLTLKAFPADELQDSAHRYKEMFNDGISSSTALWLMRDNKLLDEKAVVPYILEQAWRKRVVVFSSNPNHVSRGALFSLFPDNRGLGRQLGQLANELHDHQSPVAAIQPLRAVRTAVNLRTAEHLGLDIDTSDRSAVQLVFPTR